MTCDRRLGGVLTVGAWVNGGEQAVGERELST